MVVVMHELDIAKRIAKAVKNVAEEKGFKEVHTIRLRVGVANAANSDQLIHFIKEQSNVFKKSNLEIEKTEMLLKCNSCNNEFTDERFLNHDFAHTYAHAPALYIAPDCPKCSSKSSKITRGTELDLISIEGD